jgi:hypothetical protein
MKQRFSKEVRYSTKRVYSISATVWILFNHVGFVHDITIHSEVDRQSRVGTLGKYSMSCTELFCLLLDVNRQIPVIFVYFSQ